MTLKHLKRYALKLQQEHKGPIEIPKELENVYACLRGREYKGGLRAKNTDTLQTEAVYRGR